jgi:dihydroorotate dehydrogenase
VYRLLFKLVLQHIPPELAHTIAVQLTRSLGALPGARRLSRRFLASRESLLSVDALGLRFPSPVGVAAGLDKNLTWFEELGCIGFGFVEVGTVTALPQAGNPGRRVHRLIEDRAMINSMGFPNAGAVAARERLRKRTPETLVAVNVGKSKAATEVVDDYRTSVRELAPLADLIVLNVSSPNTRGLRDLQQLDLLASLVAAVRSELTDCGAELPLLVKLSPDLSDAELDGVAALTLDLGLDGIVAVNTTTSRPPLQSSSDLAELPGGLSGPPLKARALDVLRRLYARTQGQVVLISVGGIETPEDAWERLRAGATLVQAHTGFVYGGPLWPYRMNRGLTRIARAHGFTRIQDAVGSADTASHLPREAPERADYLDGALPPSVYASLRAH